MAFQVRVRALTGTLVGGVIVHNSAPFIKFENAMSWAEQNQEANTAAGRNFSSRIVPIMRPNHECADYQS